MKTIIATALIIVLGVSTGVAVGWYRVNRYPWPGYPVLRQPGEELTASSRSVRPEVDQPPRPPELEGPQPDVYVVDPVFDFGKMESQEVRNHEFEVRNRGDAPLVLTRGPTTCRCTVVDFDELRVPPGQSVAVTMEWDAKDFVGPITQRATVFTNDPNQPEFDLTITGKVVRSVRAMPSSLTFSRVPLDQETVGEVRVFGYRDTPVEVTGVELTQEGTSEFFEVDYTPMSEAELELEPDATNGYLVKLLIKPGLPLGTFTQRLVIKTDQEDVAKFDVPISGRVVSDVEISGTYWNKDRGVLTIGRVRRSEGGEGTVMVRLTGMPSDKLEVDVEEAIPDLLEVDIGQPIPAGGGRSTLLPVTVRVPKDSRPANYFGWDEDSTARVILSTNHPEATRIKIGVRFVSED